jgi:hypothetical protein
MTGAGNRQELGQALDDTENQGLNRNHQIHVPALWMPKKRKKNPGRREAVGALYQQSYLAVAGAAAFLCFLLLFFLVAGFAASAAGAAAAGASAAIGAAALGISAAIAAAAMPRVNNAEVIKVPDLFMRSPNGGIDKRLEEYAAIHPFQPR